MCFGGAFGGLPKLKQASKAIFPPSPEAMDTMVWVDVQVAGFLWCSFSSDVSHFHKCFPLSLRVSFLVVLFSMPVGVLQVISALCLQSCRRRQDITWYYLCCCSSHLVSGSCLCHNQCVPHGGGPQCREHVRCICSISARFIWAPPAHEETEDQALSDGELLGSVDASPPRFGWLAKNDKYARGQICQMSGTEMQNEHDTWYFSLLAHHCSLPHYSSMQEGSVSETIQH